MNKVSPIVKPCVIALACCMALLSGCGHTVMPKNIPMIRGYETISLSGASLILLNAEKDSSEYAIATDTGAQSALLANRQAWAKMLVESLSGELARRGARLSSKASLTLSITLPEIFVARNKDHYQFKIKVLVSSSTGWSRNYEGMAGSEPGSFESVSALVDRLAGQALADAVKMMLSDAEFLMQARTR